MTPGDRGADSAPPATWSVEEHLADVLDGVQPLEPLELHLLDALGCVLAEDVAAPGSVPPFDNSSMDGYAVRAADAANASDLHPAVLAVLGDAAAGAAELPEVGEGQAVRIMTGAPLPPGADAVVPVEWTDGGSGSGEAADSMRPASADGGPAGEVRVLRPAEPGGHVRRAGSDVTAGQVVLTAGTVLGPAQVGLLAAVGLDRAKVRPQPRVAVLSTGSELVAPGGEPAPGQIYDSNSYALTAAVREAGGIAFRVGAVPDEAEALRNAVEDQLVRADLVVTSGGVSVGAYDVVKEVFQELGEVDFRRLRMQPGKPQGYGRIGPDATPLFALPGNPVSSFVSFELFVRPVIRAMMGLPASERHRPTVRAKVTEELRSPAGRQQYLRGRYDAATGTAEPVGGSGSHLVAALARANCLLVVPESATSVAAGDDLDVVLLPD